MRILYIVPEEFNEKTWGGVSTYTANIAKKLSKNNDVTILSPGNISAVSIIDNLRVVKLCYNNNKIFFSNFWKYLIPGFSDTIQWLMAVLKFYKSNEPFDIVETSEWGSSALFLSLFTPAKIVIRLHKSSYQFEKDNLKNNSLDSSLIYILELCSIICASAISAPTKFIINTHRILFLLKRRNKKNIVIISNGVDFVKDLKVITKKREKFLLTVGRLEPGKGVFILLKTFVKLSKRYPYLRLIFIGKDQMFSKENISVKENMEAFISYHNLEKKIIIYDHMKQKKLLSFYKKCYIYITASIGYENQPMSLLEAIMAGKPVVVTNAGGLSETVNNKISGIVVQENNDEDLKRGVEELLKNKNLYNTISKNNIKKRMEFSSKITAHKTLTFYENLLI